jgi:phage shock protein PspC (stress-responsive transcriptional regulator)
MFTPVRVQKKLALSRHDKKIAGVCGGFAEYLELDPTLVRLIWLMLTLLAGWGLVAYIVAWIVMPQEGEALPAAKAAPSVAPQPAPNH